MSQSEYPKWITRAPGIGPVQVINAAEEKKLLDDWKEDQDALALAEAEAAAEDAKKQAALAKEAAKGAK